MNKAEREEQRRKLRRRLKVRRMLGTLTDETFGELPKRADGAGEMEREEIHKEERRRGQL